MLLHTFIRTSRDTAHARELQMVLPKWL